MPKPSVGRIVHYTDNAGGPIQCRAAIITDVVAEGVFVDLQVFLPASVGPVYAVAEGEPDDLYTWHWPERTDD